MIEKTAYGLTINVLQSILDLAERHNLSRVILFGSRARGDYKDRSDIDLAVCGGNADIFGIDVEEEVPTLLKFDVVNLDKPVQRELLDSITREGVIIYEKI